MPAVSVKRVLLLLFLLLLTACAGSGREPEHARFTLLYTADTHGHVVSSANTIGLDRVAGVKRALAPSLLLDAGDFSDGTPLAVLDKGESMVGLMKKAGYFAAALGNHEFTYGRAVLAQRVAQAEGAPGGMAVLSANTLKADGTLLVPATAQTALAGVRLCVYGLTTGETKTQAAPSAVADLDFLDPVAASRDTARALRAAGCEVVVALAHIGNGAYVPLKSTAVAEATPGLDIMIDGHSHLEFEERLPAGALVVSPGAHGAKLGRLDVEYDREQGKIVSMANTLLTPEDVAAFLPDTALAAEIAALEQKAGEKLNVPVGEAQYTFDGGRERVRTRETNLGNLVADSLRAAHGTDFALVNGGSIRDSIQKGPVSGADILAVCPFPGNVVSYRITGTELKEALEHGLSAIPLEFGGFPQVSGMVVHIDAQSPAGQRVRQLLLPGGGPVNMQTTYTIAVNGFLAEGGDGYGLFAGKKRHREFSSPQTALENHIRLTGTGGYAPGPATRLLYLP